MNKFVLLFSVLVLAIGCASNESKKEVIAEAANKAPITNPATQYERALAMIEANPDLSDAQKDKLDQLVNKYANIVYEKKEKESQYRAVLIDEMMKNDENNVDKISAAKKNLTQINTEASKNLESFVNEFKAIVGKSAHSHQPEMMEVILIE